MPVNLLDDLDELEITPQPAKTSTHSRSGNRTAGAPLDTGDRGGAWGSFLSSSREARLASKNDSQRGSRPGPLKSNTKQTPELSNDLWRVDEAGSNVLFDASTENVRDDDNDDWGEFEAAEPSLADNGLVGFLDSSGDSNPTLKAPTDLVATATAKSEQPSLIDLLDWDGSSQPTSNIPSATTNDAKPGTKQHAFVDLLSIIDDAQPKKTIDLAPKDDDEDAESWGEDWEILEENDPKNTAPPEPERELSDEEWGDFTDAFEPEPPSKPIPPKQSKPKSVPVDLTRPKPKPQATRKPPASESITLAKASSYQVHRLNIPPPSILLPLFPPLLEQYHQRVKESKQTETQDPHLISSLTSVLKAMIRIIAGRTLRWKRDAVLSQGMRIGPARSGRAGGMKLSSLNKSENVKEEKEVVEVLEAWRKRANFLNAAIVSAGGKPIPTFPANGNIQVRTATAEEGYERSQHACGLCGLKRDERVVKIDDDVYDEIFEFWWVDLWGHADCMHFWQENAASLAQR
ncbi:hypothetical protein FQN53_002520 [Emmonsiellopsis sp. PD_33]|nr:hypothetical protein FQN53_002520 [Emmonsiellopsis sp. PD_33]KAK2801157.1 hypothetical protein FQN51_005472 [Onygenales sp. PD_10]